MIISENVTYNGRDFIHHYSDAGFMMLQVETGIKYADAVDIYSFDDDGNRYCRYTYEETDEPIAQPEPELPEPGPEDEISPAQALSILMGDE